ncbi:fimbrial isopeptide formation D2 family protein/LPXTG-motif cell wall-anchored protein/uncharacterized repeat protein (TIGR02543 family) [Aequitasia blattaphilus]|uniref:Isopeptide-forming domain-containing fimbrial protein n=1 Tax=Aequitasia blattaphilus TaxID=2949332 RepID=A0ABT1EC99_9FIRM|nr:isopeptide-forming domain-containing fimbrial protein [Aequitasia blattaphilus]MCP1103454.1 isopeptide-forming domain-containing fimbrial protein [Aequitasia blattaphilus]MCR8616094.1 isopeptide-forming domain-containing fimbrial protein [Aequitasia blattaphilus]
MRKKKGLSSFLAWLLVVTMLIPSQMIALAQEPEEDERPSETVYTVQFVDADGNELKAVDITEGQEFPSEELPDLGEVPEGKEFWGWYTEAESEKANEDITKRATEVDEALATYNALSDEDKAAFDCGSLSNELKKEETEATEYDIAEGVVENIVLTPIYGNVQKELPTNPEPVAMAPMASFSGDKIELENGDVLTLNGTSFDVAGTNPISGGTITPGVTYVEIQDGATVTIDTIADTTIKYVYGDKATATFTGAGKLITDNGYSDQSQEVNLNTPNISILITGAGLRMESTVAGVAVERVIVDGANVDFRGDYIGLFARDIEIINGATFYAECYDRDMLVSTTYRPVTEKSKSVYGTRSIQILSGAEATSIGYQTGFFSYGDLLIDNATVTGTADGAGTLGGICAKGDMTITGGAHVEGYTNSDGIEPHYYTAGIATQGTLTITGSTTYVYGAATNSQEYRPMFGIWATGYNSDKTIEKDDHDVLVVDSATVIGQGGAAGICVGSRTSHDIGAVTRITNGAKVTGEGYGANGNCDGFSSLSQYYRGKVFVSDSELTATSVGLSNDSNHYANGLSAGYLTLDNAVLTATSASVGGHGIYLSYDYKSTNSTVVSTVSAENLPPEAYDSRPRCSFASVFGKYEQINGTYTGEGGISCTDSTNGHVLLSTTGTIDISSDETGVIAGGNLSVNDTNSDITIIGRTAPENNLVGVNAGGTVSVDKGTLTAVKAKDAGIIAKGDISATTGGTISGACTDLASTADDKGGVLSIEGDITADNGTINGTTVHPYSREAGDAHAAVHPCTDGKKIISKNNGIVNEYYSNKFQKIYKTGWQTAYAELGLTIQDSEFKEYTWTSHGATNWTDGANGNIEVNSGGTGLKATAIEPTEYLVANSKTPAATTAKVTKDGTSAHNVNFIVTLADSTSATLKKQVKKGDAAGDFTDDVTVKEVKKDDIYTYRVEMHLPTTGTAGYNKIEITDTLPTELTLSGTSPKSVTVKVGSTNLTLNGNDVENSGTKVGELTFTSGKLTLTLNAEGVKLLPDADAKVTMDITVKALADVAEGTTITNKATIVVNNDESTKDDSNDSKIVVIEQPKDLKKQVKNDSNVYVDTITINKGTEKILDYKISFKMPSTFAGYTDMIIVDEAPAGTTFEAGTTFKVDGTDIGTISTNSDNKLIKVELTAAQLTGYTGKDAVLNVKVKVPSDYSGDAKDGIVNTASYWINPAEKGGTGTNASKPGGTPDGTTSNTVSMNDAFSVTYDANGAATGTVPVDNDDHTIGSRVTVKDNTGSLAIPDYKFTGWNTKADGSGTFYDPKSSDQDKNSFLMPDENVTLYAQWEVSKDIGILKLNGSDGNSPMNGVEFELKEGLTSKGTKTSNPSGELDFTGLAAGTYKLYETKTLAGYQLPYGHWEITISEDTTTTPKSVKVEFAAKKALNGGTPPAVELDTAKNRYVIYNYKTYDLPKTGSTITAVMIMLMGLMILGFTGMVYIKKRKNRGV